MEYVNYLLILFIALLFSLIITPVLLHFAHKKQIYDIPDYKSKNGRRVHLLPIPKIGGVAIVLSFFSTLIFWEIYDFLLIFSISLILFVLGLWDDLKNLSPKLRLCLQIFAACLVTYFANLSLKWIVITSSLFFQLPVALGFVISVFIIVGAINAMNMTDGLDGLASGALVIGISILSYFIFVFQGKHQILTSFTIPLLGCLIGFLKFNTYPSKIFMGDSGSNWLGFLTGILILIVANANEVIPLISIILAFAVPIFDTAHVIFMRVLNGQNPMYPDNRHLHHSLIKIGFSHSQSVGIIYFLMFFFGTLGMLPVALPHYPLFWVPWMGLFIMIILLGFIIPYRTVILKKLLNNDYFKKQTQIIKKPIRIFAMFLEQFHRYSIYLLIFTTPLLIINKLNNVSICLSLICIVMGLYYFIRKTCSFISAGIIVVTVQLLFSIGEIYNIEVDFFKYSFHLQRIYNLVFLYLFFSTIFSLTIALKNKFFIITPTDILFTLIPLLIFMIPGTWVHGYGVRLIILQGIVLFTALRLSPLFENSEQIFEIDSKDSKNNFDSIPSPNLKPKP